MFVLGSTPVCCGLF
uniref:Uncharacterized protein n=1 Tax=Arundo donax TaxID=35708 RepID=A0A0A9FD77_ARUDO